MKLMKNYLMHIQNSVDNILVDGLNKKFDFDKLKEFSKYTIPNSRIAYEKMQIEEKRNERTLKEKRILEEQIAAKKAIKLQNLEKARAAKLEKQQFTMGKYSIFNKESNKKKRLEVNDFENKNLTLIHKIKFSLLFIALIFMIMFLLSKCE